MSEEETITVFDILENQARQLQERHDDLIERALDAASNGYQVSTTILNGIDSLERQMNALASVISHASIPTEGAPDVDS